MMATKASQKVKKKRERKPTSSNFANAGTLFPHHNVSVYVCMSALIKFSFFETFQFFTFIFMFMLASNAMFLQLEKSTPVFL
jgi:hypothetical protein